MITLRPYQIDAINRLAVSIKANQRSVLVAPTGAGKTVIAAEIIRRCLLRNYKILFLAHRRELIEQCSNKLTDLEIDHGIIKSGMSDRFLPHLPVQIASIQTLHSRIKSETRWRPEADLIICDEAHRIRGETWIKTLDEYQNAKVIGLTATPYRLDGKGLGAIFNDLVVVAHVDELIEMGFLIKPEHLLPVRRVNLSDVKKKGADYDPEALEQKMMQGTIVADCVEQYKKHALGRPAIVFCSTVDHSKCVRDAYLSHGIKAEHIDGECGDLDRVGIMDRFRRREFDVLCNVNIATEGFDFPQLEVCQLARPTLSMALYRQMCGRVMRPFDGKDRAIILDHAGCLFEHGLLTDRIEFSLKDSIKKKKKEMFICQECLEAYHISSIVIDDRGFKFAPCGHPHVTHDQVQSDDAETDRNIAVLDGELVNISETVEEHKKECKSCRSKSIQTWIVFRKHGKKKIRSLSVRCNQCGFFYTYKLKGNQHANTSSRDRVGVHPRSDGIDVKQTSFQVHS